MLSKVKGERVESVVGRSVGRREHYLEFCSKKCANVVVGRKHLRLFCNHAMRSRDMRAAKCCTLPTDPCRTTLCEK